MNFDEEHPIEEEDENIDEREDMEDEIEPELQMNEDQSIGFEEFRQLVEMSEEDRKNGKNSNDQQARTANFIRRGTYIHQLLVQIKTGEQAISFFAKYGYSTPIKFLNCNRKPVPADQFRPYDLITVRDEKALNDEYFTIST